MYKISLMTQIGEGEENMNTKKTDLYGKFEYKGKMYPFFYEDSFVTVIQQPWEYNEDFEKESYIEKIAGVTNSNKVIIFLKCEFLGGKFKQENRNIIFSTKGFVLFDKSDDPFDCIEFESDALNAFYPPIQIMDSKAIIDERTYKIKNSADITKTFVTNVNEENINMELTISWRFSHQPENRSMGEKYSVWRMKFESPKYSENIAKYYLYLLDFLKFVNFRQNITIDHFILYKIGKDNPVGIGKFFSHETANDSKAVKSITFEDMACDEVSRLFSCIAMQRNQTGYNDSYIPRNTEKFCFFDWTDWLNTAVGFEGEYSKKYKNQKYQSDLDFAKAKDYLLGQIALEVEATEQSINNKSNKAWAKFKHLIEHTDYRLEEKFEFMLQHFSKEISILKNQFLNRHNVSDEINLADEYAEYRNKLAHGDVIDINDANAVNFNLMRVFIYCLILERACITEDVRKWIVEKLFHL